MSVLPYGGIVKPSDAMDFFNMEIWKDIKGYEGFYQISNFGNVKSLERLISEVRLGKPIKRKIKSRIIKPSLTKSGYLFCFLYNSNGVKKNHLIHRLVGVAFIPNSENKPTINHINGIKTDNSVNNLEWNTYLENGKHARDNKLNINFGENSKNHKITDLQVAEIRRLRILGETTYGIAKKFNITHCHVSDLCNFKKRKKITVSR